MLKMKILLPIIAVIVVVIIVCSLVTYTYYKKNNRVNEKITLSTMKLSETPQITENSTENNVVDESNSMPSEENAVSTSDSQDTTVASSDKNDNTAVSNASNEDVPINTPNKDIINDTSDLKIAPKMDFHVNKDPYFFSIVANIPEELNTDEIMDRNKFNSFVGDKENKKVFCDYTLKTIKIYHLVNNESRTYSKYKVKNLVSLENCLNLLEWSEYDLYQLYVATYYDYIRTDPSQIDTHIIENINKAKSVRIRTYFNIVEDIPSFLNSNNILPKSEFQRLVNTPKDSEVYCKYYSNFVKSYNQATNNRIAEINVNKCKNELTTDQTYEDYLALYQYLYPEKYNFKSDALRVINLLRNYKLIIIE